MIKYIDVQTTETERERERERERDVIYLIQGIILKCFLKGIAVGERDEHLLPRSGTKSEDLKI